MPDVELSCLVFPLFGLSEMYWAQGLTKADLMGDLTFLLQLPAYQLALPFFVEAQRQLALGECLTGTPL